MGTCKCARHLAMVKDGSVSIRLFNESKLMVVGRSDRRLSSNLYSSLRKRLNHTSAVFTLITFGATVLHISRVASAAELRS